MYDIKVIFYVILLVFLLPLQPNLFKIIHINDCKFLANPSRQVNQLDLSSIKYPTTFHFIQFIKEEPCLIFHLPNLPLVLPPL